MIQCIDGLLPPAALAALMLALPQPRLQDGAAKAGWSARSAKRKLQPGDRSAPRLRVQPLVEHALSSHEVFVAAALPRAIAQRLVSRTTAGGGHGKDVDNAIMGRPPLRTDLAFTLFLSHPSDYQGGELVIDEPQGEQCFKLPAGHLMLYPATTLHRVNPAASGVSHVAAGWAHSLVRDPQLRALLFELDLARRELFQLAPGSRAFELLDKSCANLLRMRTGV